MIITLDLFADFHLHSWKYCPHRHSNIQSPVLPFHDAHIVNEGLMHRSEDSSLHDFFWSCADIATDIPILLIATTNVEGKHRHYSPHLSVVVCGLTPSAIHPAIMLR